MRVILVRHGQTDWNQEGIFRGRIDVELNAEGIQQARTIGEKLSKIAVDGIYSSPLSRAMETSEIIASFRNRAVQVLDELTDIDFGKWQGLSQPEAKERYPQIYTTWERRPEKVKIPDAETLDDVRIRVINGLNSILSDQPDGTVIVISHGLVNKVLLCAVLGLANSHFWKIKQDNGAVNVFKYTEHGSKVFLMNDTSHIRTMNEIIEEMRFIENPLG